MFNGTSSRYIGKLNARLRVMSEAAHRMMMMMMIYDDKK